MSRNIIGIFNQVWASSGDRAELPTFTAGYDSDYELSKFPQREPLNDVLAKVCAVATDVNKFGATLPWDSGITFEPHSIVTGSDGTYYVAVIQNVGFDPIVAGNRPTYWITLAEALGISDLKTDKEIVALSSHNVHPLSTTRTSHGVTTRTYAIAEFIGAGLNVSDVRGLYAEYLLTGDLYSSYNYARIKATYPNGTNLMVANQIKNINDNEGLQGGTVFIPINKNQTSVTVRIDLDFWSNYSMNGTITFKQAMQRKA